MGAFCPWERLITAARLPPGLTTLRRLADLLTISRALLGLPLLWLASRGTLPLWAIWLLLARELFISGWRAGQGSGGPASLSGKAKTILQFAALLLLLWPNGWTLGLPTWAEGDLSLPIVLQAIGWWLFWPSLLLALSSAWGYLRKA